MSDLKFGEPVVVTNLMHRTVSDDGHFKRWVPRPDYIKPKRREGIFLGYRTLQNGNVTFGGWEESTTWEQTGTVRVALVCFSGRENPKYAPVDAVAPLRETR